MAFSPSGRLSEIRANRLDASYSTFAIQSSALLSYGGYGFRRWKGNQFMAAAPAPQAARPGLFRRTPPAVFPGLFGLLGLGLAWRRAAEAFSLDGAIPETLLGAATLLYLFALLAYVAKFARRPAVVLEDLRILPGRAGLAAMTLSVLLLAAVALPYDASLARGLLVAGLILHGTLAALVVWVLVSGPEEQRQVTPAWHLSFVGFILAPLSALPLGLVLLAQIVTVATGVAAGLIYAISLVQLIRRDPPPPLRPLLAIHLAPLSLFGTVAYLFGNSGIALVFAGLGLLLLAVLLVRAPYLTAAGFSPLWGAFTFPLAAFTSLAFLVAGDGGPEVFRLIGAVALVAGTIGIPMIVVKVLQAWAKGVLAAKTNAAIA
jgi:tellurite resistance protein